jgi:stage V sporulation protein R
VTKPTDEDRAWAPDIAGRNDVMGVLKEIWENYRDDSFIAQYLSPRLMREMKFFNIEDNPREPELVVGAIHDERGYRKLRRALARRYDPSESDPLMEVASVDLLGDRRLILDHKVLEGRTLSASASRRALQHIADLWGYDVELRELDNSTGQKLAEHQARPQHPFGAG